MNKDQVEGNWNQFKGKIKETWGKLTDDDVALYNGKREQFFGKLQEKYGLAKEEAEERVKEMEDACQTASRRSHKVA